MKPAVSVIIPGHNRIEPLKTTLRSAAAAAARLPAGSVEILLVDDGSTPPLTEQLTGFDPGHSVVHLFQSNQGSIVARLTGLASAQGERVLFLDSDDLIHPNKLAAHLNTDHNPEADIIYDDMAEAALGPDYTATFTPGRRLARTVQSVELLLKIQPPPHNPVYRRAYLARALSRPIIPQDRHMDPAGDVWLNYNLAPHSARVAKIDAPLTAVGPHREIRYSLHWEKIGIAALLIAEAFQRHCPTNASTLAARQTVGEIAFEAWRRLPYDFHPDYTRRQLAVWQRAPRGRLSALGRPNFVALARIIGPTAAGHLFRRLRGKPYANSRTLSDEELADLLFSRMND